MRSIAGQADTNSAEQPAPRLAAAGRHMMNCHSGRKYSIHLVVGGASRSRNRRRGRSAASVANNAISVGCRLRVRQILRAADKLVARTPNFWVFDQELAPRRQHRPQSEAGGDHCHCRDTSDHVAARCAVVDRRLSDSSLECGGHIHPNPTVADLTPPIGLPLPQIVSVDSSQFLYAKVQEWQPRRPVALGQKPSF